ncbi:MAG: hypothetical protein AB7G76_14220 [Steroidobacteraceae bacterium]
MLARAAVLAVFTLVGASPCNARALAFEVREGANINWFLREGPVAAHVVLRSGMRPRILVAFPAGNSGVGLWFEPRSKPDSWSVVDQPRPVHAADAGGRALHGVKLTAAIDAPSLTVCRAVLSSVRVLRDYELGGPVPAAVEARGSSQAGELQWARDRLDGAPGYLLRVRPVKGRLATQAVDDPERADASTRRMCRGDAAQIVAPDDGRIELEITAATGEPPLTPLPAGELLTADAAPDAAMRQTLEFLAFREKFLAGSWRFLTYFGRDTLMTLRLLMPVLTPRAVEAGIESVLARLSARGQVAHEESIGEYAVLEHRAAQGTTSSAPVYDYGMIDGDFLLAPVVASWLLDDPRGRARAAAFLGSRTASDGGAGEPGAHDRNGDRLLRNLRLVMERAAPFAADPRRSNLVALLPGRAVGEWRDSHDGLGGGRYPFDVNAALVPAAVAAAARLRDSGLLTPYLAAADRARLSGAARAAAVWREKAAGYFVVRVAGPVARADIRAYAGHLGVSADAALGALAGGRAGDGGLRFHAIALDAAGAPIPIVNSDEGFVLLLGHPDARALDLAVTSMMRPFPAGLLTGAGLVVANPAFAPTALQGRFSRDAYHGTVIWSWQQALLAAGLQRQLQRRDLSAQLRQRLASAQSELWAVIEAARGFANSELWSWRYERGQYAVAPFGAEGAHVDESNAAQLWSTAYLAMRPPESDPP